MNDIKQQGYQGPIVNRLTLDIKEKHEMDQFLISLSLDPLSSRTRKILFSPIMFCLSAIFTTLKHAIYKPECSY